MVTIVVLLILAGISINLVLGDNGIIGKAKDAKISLEIAKVQDALDFKITGNDIDKVVGDSNNDVYKVDGFVKETKIIDGGEDKDIYIIKDLSKIDSSSTIGKGTIPSGDNINLSDLRDNLIIDQDNKVFYIDNKGKKFGKDTINGFKKVVGSSSEWVVEYQQNYGNTLVKYLGNDNDIVIPNYVDDKKIDSIGSKLFRNSTKTGTLIISEGIKNIEDDAFSKSKFTGDLIIPDSVIQINDSAFAGCSNFSGKLVIGKNVNKIGFYTFTGTNFSGDLFIGENTEDIDYGAFWGCKGFDGNLILNDKIETIRNTVFSFCSGLNGDLIMGKNVKYIETAAFQSCTGFDGNLILNEGIEEIEDNAFYNCTGLKGDLIIPSTVNTIGKSAFQSCSFNGKLYIPNNVTTIGESSFAGTKFNNIVVDTSIADGRNFTPAYDDVKARIEFGKNVKEIADYGFAGFVGLTGDLIIPDSVTKIGNYAFVNCTGFNGNLIIGNGVTEIPSYAFVGMGTLNGNLVIGNGVKSIASDAFKASNGSDRTDFLGNLVIGDGLTEIPSGMFSSMSFKGNLTLGKNVENIGSGAFSSCSGFTGNLIIPSSVTTIGMAAFSGCSGFTGNLIIPTSVTKIEGMAFAGCSGLNENLVIESEYLSISNTGAGTFYGTNIKNCIILSKNCDSIGAGAFASMGQLETIYIPSAIIPQIQKYAFGGVNQSATIYTDATGADSSWQEDWNAYGNGNLNVVYNTSVEQYKTMNNIEY